uniref:Uncharacterized protein n=1 Tax=Cacopsylla melanoneura TaxID=428564 RepID=A0A8D8PRS5_9HEMI
MRSPAWKTSAETTLVDKLFSISKSTSGKVLRAANTDGGSSTGSWSSQDSLIYKEATVLLPLLFTLLHVFGTLWIKMSPNYFTQERGYFGPNQTYLQLPISPTRVYRTHLHSWGRC